jgi:CBS domain-containing protein
MSTVQEVLNRKGHDVVTVKASDNVLTAARLMNERRVGSLTVTEGDSKVIGIFTERDVLCRIVAAQRDPATTLVREVMTAPVACCSPETTQAECRAVMRHRRVRHLPVVKDDRLVGIVSIGDILEVAAEQQQQTIRYLYEYMLGTWSE